MKRYSVRVEVHVGAEHPDAACERIDQLMSPVHGAPWLVVFADEDREQASQGTERDSLKRYVVRVEVYVDTEHPDIAREQVERLMAPVHEAPWRIRYIRGATPSGQQRLDEKYATGDGRISDIP